MDPATSPHAAALWVGLHIFLLLTLSALVVRQRRRHHVELGDGGVPELERAIRAFGNAAEYAPAGLIALVVLAAVGAHPTTIHIAGLLLFAGRVVHAVGLSNSSGASLPRAMGMIATWLAYVFAGVALVFYAIV